ncbi:MAG: ATP-binding cassette domain-containing protein [Mollicutes bacterium PWAP]|nr:ATP-binding cassette domain-containing protein [Mollicutes bacterium PWAP]
MKIEVKDIYFTFDKNLLTESKALQSISTSFEKKELVSIIGESSSGKTVFIEHLNALRKPQKGFLNIDGTIVKKFKKLKRINEIRTKVGVVFQFAEYQLFKSKIIDDVMFGPLSMKVGKIESRKRAEKYLNLVGIEKYFYQKSPFELSGGQKRRVAIAGILAMEPKFLIFDEPTGGLDPEGEKEMYKLFKKLISLGKNVIVVTSNMDHALEHSTRSLVLKKGKIIYDGDTKKLFYEKNLFEMGLIKPKIINFLEKTNIKTKEYPTNIDELVKILKKG